MMMPCQPAPPTAATYPNWAIDHLKEQSIYSRRVRLDLLPLYCLFVRVKQSYPLDTAEPRNIVVWLRLRKVTLAQHFNL